MRSGCDAAALLYAKGLHTASGTSSLVVSEAGRGHGRGEERLPWLPYCQRALACLLAASISRTGGTESCAQLSLSELKLAKSSTDHLFHVEKRASHLITHREVAQPQSTPY
ncbi:uncharacterized protein TrAtP1_000664 [Trichoderma atroviride]|uniref:uncharacterized protein n=1 Tax=Hypocrea atroviridis TaxID=63577 RepID=UPI0033340B5B|nr:hypothetical protein TrAtP1_000664 [Trichoderma atroviride]